MKIKRLSLVLALLLSFCLLFSGCDELLGGFDLGDGLGGLLGGDIGDGGKGDGGKGDGGKGDGGITDEGNVSLDDIPAYSGNAYVAVNGNVPFFTEEEITASSYEYYSELDALGRCGVVHASLGMDTMPPKGDERGEIGHVKPSGWIQGKYNTSLVDGGWLYNRCHLIGWQLSDEDDNERNLISGTRYLNIEGMLPFENMVAAHLREDGGHVMYRVTPIYEGNNLLPSGVLMEAYSVEDEGEAISFCVYCYNVQPGILIDYKTGANCLDDGYSKPDAGTDATPEVSDDEVSSYVLNKSSLRVHKPTCSSVESMASYNKEEYTGTLTELLSSGYRKCGACFK